MVRGITISREFGSGGSLIGRMLADRLGWKLVDSHLVSEIARNAHIDARLAARFDECVDPWFHRLLKLLWQGGYEGFRPGSVPGPFDAAAMFELWRRVIEESGELGQCVIIGRGGQCLLQDRPGIFHVSLFAPEAVKVELLKREGTQAADPIALMHETDRNREAYVRRHFGRDWTDRSLYNLIIRTGIPIEPYVDAILDAAGLRMVAA